MLATARLCDTLVNAKQCTFVTHLRGIPRPVYRRTCTCTEILQDVVRKMKNWSSQMERLLRLRPAVPRSSRTKEPSQTRHTAPTNHPTSRLSSNKLPRLRGVSSCSTPCWSCWSPCLRTVRSPSAWWCAPSSRRIPGAWHDMWRSCWPQCCCWEGDVSTAPGKKTPARWKMSLNV